MAFSGQISNILNMLMNPPRTSTPLIAGSEDEDDMNQVQAILSGLNRPERQPGIAQTILEAIPQAIAVAFAQDPAGALADQLKNRQVLQEREKERKERIKQLGAQLQIEDILSRGKERRAEAATVRGETRADRRAVADYLRNSGFQLRKIDIENKNAKELLDIQQSFADEQRGKRFTDDKALLEAKSSADTLQRRIALETEFALPLIFSKQFEGDEAVQVYEKIATKGLNSLTSDERKKITKARDLMQKEDFRQRMALVHAQNRGSGSESLGSQITKMAIQRASATTLGTDAQGNVRELIQSQLPGEGMVLPDGSPPTRILTEPEETKYFIDQFSKLTPGAFGGGLTSTDINQDQASSLKLDQIIQQARNVEKLSDAQIIQNLNDPTIRANLGITSQQVQDAVTRNKLGIIQESPEQKRFREIESQLGKSIVETPEVKQLRKERLEIKAKADEAKRKADAPKIIADLQGKLEKTKSRLKTAPTSTISGGGSKAALRDEIKDLERRLEDAYQANPELRPK